MHSKLGRLFFFQLRLWIAVAGALVAPLTSSAQEAPSYVDDFAGGALGTGWTAWDGYAEVNPGDPANHASFDVSGTHLSIAFPGGTEHNQWWFGHAQVSRAYEGSGGYEIRLDTGMDGTQQFGLVFQSGPKTFLMFMFYGGSEIVAYVERFAEVGGVQYRHTLPGEAAGFPTGILTPDSGPYFLRVTVDDDVLPSNRSWRFQWSRDGVQWTTLLDDILETGAPEQNIGAIQEVGFFAGNQPSDYNAFDARFDYFRSFPLSAIPVPAPTDLVATVSDQTVDLRWDAVAGADEYRIHRSLTSGGPYSEIASTTSTVHTDAGLVNGTNYYYVVTAHIGTRASLDSNEFAAAPVAPTVNGSVPTAGLLLALEADALRPTFASGESVTQWTHVFGGGAVASAAPTHAPTFINTAINGHAAVRFDGVDDYLDLPGGFDDFTSGLTFIVVARLATLQDGFKFVSLGNGPGVDNVVLGRDGTSFGLQYFNDDSIGNVRWFPTPNVLYADQLGVFSVSQGSGTPESTTVASIRLNGQDQATGTVWVPPVQPRLVNYLGKSFWNEGLFKGDIAEVLIYDRQLSSEETAALQAYLDQKYAVTALPPQPLSPPSGVTVSADDARVTVAWTGDPDAVGYRVLRSTTAGGPYQEVWDGWSTVFTDTGLTNGTTYHYVVQAFDYLQDSGISQEVSATPDEAPPLPPLDPPAGVTALGADGIVALGWGIVADATAYRVYRADQSGGPHTLLAEVVLTSFSDTQVVNGQVYFYLVTARDGVRESAPSLEVSAAPAADLPPPPIAPPVEIPAAGLVMALDAGNAALEYANGDAVTTWRDASVVSSDASADAGHAPALLLGALNGHPALRFDGVEDHLVLPPGFADFTQGMTLFIVARSTALTPGFKLLALGNGPGSQNIVLGRDGVGTSLQYFTNDSFGNVAYFGVSDAVVVDQTTLYSVVQGGGGVDASVLATVSANEGASASSTVWVPPLQTRTMNFIGKSYWDEGLFQGDLAEVILYDRILSASEESDVVAYLDAKYALGTVGTPPPLPLAPPQNLTATAGDGFVALDWDGVSEAAGYRVHRSDDGGTTWFYAATPLTSDWTDTVVDNGTAYAYVVTAWDASRESGDSVMATATPGPVLPPPPLGVPGNLQVVVGDGTVVLSWDPVLDALGYRVYRGDFPSGPYLEVAETGNLSFTNSGLVNGQSYYYVVTAYDAVQESADSLEVSATPEGDLPPPPISPPSEIPASGLQLLLSAGTAALDVAAGEALTTWRDASGGGRDATADIVSAPTLVTGALGGQPALRFDGSDDHFVLPGGFTDFTAGLSLFIVARPATLQSGFKVLSLGNGGGEQNIVLGRDGGGSGLQYFTDDASYNVGYFSTGPALVSGEPARFSVLQEAGAANDSVVAIISKNGAPVGSGSVFVPPVTNRAMNYLGKSYWFEGLFEGDIAEVILYDRILSVEEEQAVNDYLSQKYGL